MRGYLPLSIYAAATIATVAGGFHHNNQLYWLREHEHPETPRPEGPLRQLRATQQASSTATVAIALPSSWR